MRAAAASSASHCPLSFSLSALCYFSDLLVVVCLLHEVEDGDGEGGIGQREGLGGGGFVGLNNKHEQEKREKGK